MGAIQEILNGRVSHFKTALNGMFLVEINRKYYTLSDNVDIHDVYLYDEWEVDENFIGRNEEFPLVKPLVS